MREETNESSVMVSLRELVALEDERLQEEEQARERAEQLAERARRHALAERRAAEEARREADETRRAELARREAEESTRLAAIEQAEIEGARILARAAAERELDNSRQRHQREMLQLTEARTASRWKTYATVAAVAVVLAAGGFGFAWMNHSQEQRLQAQAATAKHRAERQQLAEQRRRDLDTMRDQLQSQMARLKQLPDSVTAADDKVESARKALTGDLHDRDLDDYAAALTTLADSLPRAHRLDRLAQLETLHTQASKRAAELRRPHANLKLALAAAEKASQGIDRDDPSEASLTDMHGTLKQLVAALPMDPQRPLQAGPGPKVVPPGPTGGPCDKFDPLCGDLGAGLN